jgi:8-oxo-dGTP pyrophosphatase MutT (NUDIX family)
MQPKRIRPLALGIFRHAGRLLVFEGYDAIKDQTFYRPLGGGIEFGETGAHALAREIREEIGAEVTNVRYLGLCENIFTYAGKIGHEIVLLYEAELAERSLYERDIIEAVEANGSTFMALWKPLADFADGRVLLYPDGLFDLIRFGKE